MTNRENILCALRRQQPERVGFDFVLCPALLAAVDSPAYRLLAYYVSGRLPDEELFDLDKDPEGMNNLAGDSALAEKLTELRQAADDWAVRTDDRKTRAGLAKKFPPPLGVIP
jgi:hypothetical protein